MSFFSGWMIQLFAGGRYARGNCLINDAEAQVIFRRITLISLILMLICLVVMMAVSVIMIFRVINNIFDSNDITIALIAMGAALLGFLVKRFRDGLCGGLVKVKDHYPGTYSKVAEVANDLANALENHPAGVTPADIEESRQLADNPEMLRIINMAKLSEILAAIGKEVEHFDA